MRFSDYVKLSSIVFLLLITQNSNGLSGRRCGELRWLLNTSRIPIVGSKQEVVDLLKNPEKYSREDFYRIISEAYDLTKFVNLSSYEFNQNGLGKLFTRFSDNFKVLLLDPGINSHAQELIDFVENEKTIWGDPWQLRQAFSLHLGKKTVYRGLILNLAAKNAIVERGMSCPTFCKKLYNEESQPLESYLLGSINEEIGQRVQNNGGGILLSVTDHPEIAIAVAKERSSWNKPVSVYLFTLEIPKLDLITNDHLLFMFYGIRNVRVTVDGQDFTFNEGVERFIKFRIRAEEIKNVRLIPENVKASYQQERFD